jgi:hypothetical protein
MTPPHGAGGWGAMHMSNRRRRPPGAVLHPVADTVKPRLITTLSEPAVLIQSSTLRISMADSERRREALPQASGHMAR